jgi:hypothetical protein
MKIERLAHSAAYLLFTVVLTGLGVTAWMINTIRDLNRPHPRLSKGTPRAKAEPEPESQLSGRGF